MPGTRVVQHPADHPYLRHLGLVPDGSAPAPSVWDVDGLVAAGVDVVHLHFGFEHLGVDELARWAERLRLAGIALVHTVHDLDNPHLVDQREFHAAVGVLTAAAAAVFTLTDAAADRIAVRYGRSVTVVAHPHVVPFADMHADGQAGRRRRGVYVHAATVRPNLDVALLLDLIPAARAVGGLRVHVRDSVPAPFRRWLQGAAGEAGATVEIGPRLSDEELWDRLGGAAVVALPYRWGTHSGLLEAARDLGTPALAPAFGGYRDQGAHVIDGADLAGSVRRAAASPPVVDPGLRRRERDAAAAVHVALYADLAGVQRVSGGAVLWYVHDHGRGHLDRARAVIPHVAAEVVVACGPRLAGAAHDAFEGTVAVLPSDVPVPALPTVGPWHHAPSSPVTTARALALARLVEERGCTTAVVDVSVEVTVLARLLGLRVVTLRQSGRRDDAAHQVGLATADAVWVPQHRDLEPIGSPVDERWVFTGPFSRYDGVRRPARPSRCAERLVVLLVGSGGNGLDVARWADSVPPPGWRVVIAGTSACVASSGVHVIGHREPILPLLAAADVVVTSAGWAAVADTVAAGARLVVVPESRPFDEQAVRARALAAAGLAVGCDRWPTPAELPAVLDEALALRPERWAAYHDGCGAQRAAALVDEVHGR